ncbi:glycosyltransferase family 2 protein [Roseovarius sp.]|uniref:glycosyltransferase family 2 protein n=1 Tax=Roseovarius sp. TaxID=1486281 RepID=UPI00356B189F
MAIRSQLAHAQDDPLISVIIPAYNDDKYLPESIGSVLNQTYENLECIIIDDGSTDDTEILVAKSAEKDARVRYFKKINGGVSSARNVGITKAEGLLIQFLDADDVLHFEKLANGVGFIREYGIRDEKFILHSDYEIVWGSFDDEGANRQRLCLVGLDKHGLKQQIIGRSFGLASPSPLHVGSVLLSRAVVDEHQFDENMLGYEDLEFFTRLLCTDISFFMRQ